MNDFSFVAVLLILLSIVLLLVLIFILYNNHTNNDFQTKNINKNRYADKNYVRCSNCGYATKDHKCPMCGTKM